jgi:hypothetical protein
VLLLVFLMMMLGLFALFLGGGLVAQGYLYQNPAERMPVRALAAAALVAGFITMWVWIDQKSPGRYDTFFNFAPYSTVEFDEFEAVRWAGANGKLILDPGGKPVETVVKFKRSAGGKGSDFVEEGTAKKFDPRSGTYMTGAIRVKGPNDPEPVRYNALLNPKSPKDSPTYAEPRRFVEENGSRYVEMQPLGTLFIPSTGTVALALLLNFALVVVWLVAFWPVLRFSLVHALIFTGAFALLTMVAVMPVLFKQSRVEKPKEPAAALARGGAASNLLRT